MFEKISDVIQARKIKRSEHLRIKNAKLRASGKDPHKGWGKVINTGFGGLNNMDRDGFNARRRESEIDNKAYFIQEQKNNRKKENSKLPMK